MNLFFCFFEFQSTPSVGRATRRKKSCSGIPPFQSTPSVGRATLGISDDGEALGISIHALRGEGDDKAVAENYKTIAISIHALRGEGDKDACRT